MNRNLRFIIFALISLGGACWLLTHHLEVLSYAQTNYAILFTFMFGYLSYSVLASLSAQPHVPDPDFDYDALVVELVQPVYNEDPSYLAAGIRSITGQTRLPQGLWIIDDGSTNAPLADREVAAAIAACRAAGVNVHTHVQDNRGKRHAQSYAFRRSHADVLVTLDSDTVFDAHAVENLLLPFANPETMAVGGMACGHNYKQSLFTRVVELGFVMQFISARLADGRFGAVRVNCGIIAAYRGKVVRENIFRYLNQRFRGQDVMAGDDRALTIFARERGRTEFQPNAVAYSALPTALSHLVRQRLRWARNWYWGSWNLLRRPVRTPEFWITCLQINARISYLFTTVLAVLAVTVNREHLQLFEHSVEYSVLISGVSTLRYVGLGRRDDSWASRFVTWCLFPLSSLLYMFVLTPLYWVAAVRMRYRGWGTRQQVEVALDTPQEVVA